MLYTILWSQGSHKPYFKNDAVKDHLEPKSALHLNCFSLLGNTAQIRNGTELATALQHQLSKPPTIPSVMPTPADTDNGICVWVEK